MALKRVVTKKIKMTRVTLLVFNMETEKSGHDIIELVGEYRSERKLLKKLNEIYDSSIKILKLVDWETFTTTRVMDEKTFYENSKEKEN